MIEFLMIEFLRIWIIAGIIGFAIAVLVSYKSGQLTLSDFVSNIFIGLAGPFGIFYMLFYIIDVNGDIVLWKRDKDE